VEISCFSIFFVFLDASSFLPSELDFVGFLGDFSEEDLLCFFLPSGKLKDSFITTSDIIFK
jgi:hypothetical protein